MTLLLPAKLRIQIRDKLTIMGYLTNLIGIHCNEMDFIGLIVSYIDIGVSQMTDFSYISTRSCVFRRFGSNRQVFKIASAKHI